MIRNIKNEQGFSLVTVLILSSLAGVLVINSLKDNVNQERLSGNFQKKLNARLASEQGLFDSITAAQNIISNDPTTTIDDLITALNKSSGGTTLNYGATTYNIDVSEDSGELVLSSVGERFEGESTVKVRLKIIPGASGEGFSTFTDAVVGCEGVTLKGSGQVDSYNSDLASYSASGGYDGAEGHVRTIDDVLGDVNLGGNSPIFGDVIATGNLNTLSTTITGNVHANKDVIIGENGSGAITGNVLAGGNFFLGSSAVVGGYVDAVENVTIRSNGSAIIHNNENRSEAIRYGGIVNDDSVAIGLYGEAPFKQAEGFSIGRVKDSDNTVDDYDPTNPDTNCDHLDVGNIIDIIEQDGRGILSDIDILDDADSNNSADSTTDLVLSSFTSLGSSINYDFEEDGIFYTPGQANWITSQSITASKIIHTTFLGETVDFIAYKKFEHKVDVITVYGDTYLFVDGDFTMSNNARIYFTEGSSLTVVLTGKFELKDKGLFDATGQNINPAQSFSVYSSYDSNSNNSGSSGIPNDAGIVISGHSDLYAAIYAPLSDVNIKGSAALYGSVRGKTVNVTGSGDIHYDEALREASQISGTSGGSTSSILSFVGFEY